MSHRPIVILTALDLEYDAVRARMSDPRPHRHPRGTRFEVGRLTDGGCRVALALVGKGNQAAAVLAERAISEFKPAALLFVGVAGARQSHIALGDVVVATHVYAYHGGTSEDDGFKGRPRVWEASHAADQIARHVVREGLWARGLAQDGRTPIVHFGPIAAGEVVLNSRDSAHARWLHEHYNDARAIEMEGAGIAQAGHLNNVSVVVIRGISDRADGDKEKTDGEQWQPRAAANAAAFAAALATELATELATDEGPTETGGTGMSGNRNIAKDQAHVGMQIGAVYGGVRSGHDPEPPADLAEALTGLRARLHRARAAGRLDDDTCDAAEAELAVADTALRENTSQGRSRLMLALKKVRGLLADVAELAAEVASVIALARSL
jgi:8-oxo-dGTP diphosphatase